MKTIKCNFTTQYGKSLSQSPKANKSIISYLLDDNSAEKALLSENQINDRLNKKNKQLQIQSKKAKEIKKVVDVIRAWEIIIENCLKIHFLRTEQIEKASITIQRILKGCVVRGKICPMLINIKELENNQYLKDLKRQANLCMLSLGNSSLAVFNI